MASRKKTGDEPFIFADLPKNFTLSDFWRWRSSSLMNNITRASLAEFIVANALDICQNCPPPEWESYDLLFSGKRIEIKTSAYIQAWDQRVNTNPRFSIRPAKVWDSQAGYADKASRNSEMYIFCLLTALDREMADPLVLDRWEFYPVLTSEISAMLGRQKSVGMSTICRLCPEPYDYASLRDAVVCLLEKRAETDAEKAPPKRG